MLKPIDIQVPQELLQQLSYENLHTMKTTINEPTGNFFYDAWNVKPEYKGTVWEKLIKDLPDNIGEARVIVLESGTNYFIHADIDDRYHLNLQGKDAYLVDLESTIMHPLRPDGIWYTMNAGLLHSAVNFGENPRIQLVVRQLLTHADLGESITIEIKPGGTNPRFVFDNTISPWLNKANKDKIIDNFTITNIGVKFDVKSTELDNLKKVVPETFKLIEHAKQ